ncbi:MAG: hypothetical protein AAF730_14970 [Bacteroidota bacterium]
MAEDPLIALVRRYVTLTDDQAAQIVAAWGTPMPCAPGRILLAPGRTCRSLYFMDRGYGRFYAERDAEDLTRHFIIPGILFTIAPSFASGRPAREGLQVLTRGQVRRLDTEANDALVAACPPWNAFRQAYVRAVYAYLDETLDEARYLSARARYETFAARYPDILQNVPLRYVASYLGMTPQSLSRVRASITPLRTAINYPM